MNSYTKNESKNYKVSMLWNKKSITDLDPAQIAYANEAIVLDNLYGNLIKYDNEGELVSDLVEKFYWDGEFYNFVFGHKKTSTGKNITAKDAELTLKRLIILNKNSHGKLQQYICNAENIENLNDHCSGIVIENNVLKIKTSPDINSDILMSLLTGIDFKILPEASFSKNYPFKIFDYSNTTGPYYYKPNKEGKFIFEVNTFYYQFTHIDIGKWEIIPSALFENIDNVGTKVDIITTASYVDWKNQKIDDIKGISTFSTSPISIEMLLFTNKGMEKLALSERAKIAFLIKDFLKDKLESNKQETYQFFPKDGSGWIDADKENEIKKIRDDQKNIPRLVKVGFPKSIYTKLGDTTSLLEKNIEIVEAELHNMNENKEIVAEFVSTDSSFQEDISLLEYNFSFGIFATFKESSNEWMSTYIKNSKIARLSMIKSLQYQLLSSLKIAPLYSMSYNIVIAGDWDFTLSKNNASTHLWKIKKKTIL